MCWWIIKPTPLNLKPWVCDQVRTRLWWSCLHLSLAQWGTEPLQTCRWQPTLLFPSLVQVLICLVLEIIVSLFEFCKQWTWTGGRLEAVFAWTSVCSRFCQELVFCFIFHWQISLDVLSKQFALSWIFTDLTNLLTCCIFFSVLICVEMRTSSYYYDPHFPWD